MPSVLLYHGFLSDSSMWVTHRNESLALKLANASYDVWLGNTRGSIFSRKHVKLDPYKDAKQFYDYSFYENGKYDTINSIEYILE